MSESNLFLNPTQLDPEPTKSGVDFSPHQSSNQLAMPSAHPQGESCRFQALLGTTCHPTPATYTASHTQRSRVTLTVAQPEGLTLPTEEPAAFKTQLQ